MSVSAIKVLTGNIMYVNKEELANFTFSFGVNLAMLLVSESVGLQGCNNFEVNLKEKMFLRANWYYLSFVLKQLVYGFNGVSAFMSTVQEKGIIKLFLY